MTACTLFSRLTGFVRVLATAAVLGSGLLGDVYQTANMIPNLLFELVALGVLQSVLLPSYVAARREGEDSLRDAVSATSGVVVVVLGAVAALGMATSPLMSRVMVAFEPSSAVVQDKLDVMVPMVLVFVPQLVFYGLATTASAALNARGRFAAAALAPALNNVVVIVACLLFRWSRDGAVADLHLSVLEFCLISIGTTLGVVLFGAWPWLALRRAGVRAVPRWRPEHTAVRQMRKNFGWATLSIVGTLVPTATALALGNGAPGGVAVFVFTFAFFVLPHALVAVPAATALAPRVAEHWQAGDTAATRKAIDDAVAVMVPLLALAGAGMVALAWQVADVMAFGQIASQGLEPIASAFVAFGFGLVGYGVSFVLARVLFSLDDLRVASRLMIAGAVAGVLVMELMSEVLDPGSRAAALALGYGASQAVTAVLLVRRVRRLTGSFSERRPVGLLGTSVAAAGAAALAMMATTSVFGGRRRESGAAIAVAGAVGVVVFAAVLLSVDGRARRSIMARFG
ncbi:MAG: murein biosynthesis integral membrane protein MurJ [Ilumatobacteraceae bacterium]